MPVQIQVPLPPYIVKDPRSYERYRTVSRAKYLVSLGCFRRIKDQHIDVTINHIQHVNDWQPRVYSDYSYETV
jgi:hypothetical protein